jgi:hypothetical protein
VPPRPLVPADDAGKVIGARGLSAAKTERTTVGGKNFVQQVPPKQTKTS